MKSQPQDLTIASDNKPRGLEVGLQVSLNFLEGIVFTDFASDVIRHRT